MKRSFLILLLSFLISIVYAKNWTYNYSNLSGDIKLICDFSDSTTYGRITHYYDNDSIWVEIFGKTSLIPKDTDEYFSFSKPDSVIIFSNSKYQRLNLSISDGFYRLMFSLKDYTSYGNYSIRIYDINEDGYPDLGFYNSGMSGNKNHTFVYYLFDPVEQSYKVDNRFSIPNLNWNNKTKTFSSYSSGGYGIFSSKTYKLVNDSLKIVMSISQTYDRNLDKYIKKTMEDSKIKIDTLSVEDINR